jgi:hypothetical protein
MLLESVTAVTAARPGESINVSAELVAGAPADTIVTIAGVSAPDVWLQAPARLGQWRVCVIATGGGEVDRREHEVAVGGAPAAPLLELTRNPFVALGVVVSAVDIDPEHPLLGPGDSYRWRIGTQDAVTTVALVSRDLATEVDDARHWTPIAVELTVAHPDGTEHHAQRTLALGSVYRVLRDELGQVRPPTTCDGRAIEDDALSPVYRGHFTVANIEPEGLRLTLRRTEWLADDDVTATYGPNEPIALRLGAGTSTTVDVRFDRRLAPSGAHGATVHLFGQTDSGLPVHTSATFDLVRHSRPIYRPPDLVGQPSILDKVAHVLEVHGGDPYELAGRTGDLVQLVGDVRSTGLTQQSLWALELAGRPLSGGGAPMPVMSAPVPAAAPNGFRFARGAFDGANIAANLAQDRSAAPAWLRSAADRIGINIEHLFDLVSDGVVEGASCDPDDPPDETPEFFACQFTGEYVDRLVPARVANARRGDIVLVPGGNGLIGGLLAQVHPPQRYAHTGIMTRNFTEISHATASEDYLRDHARGVHPLGSKHREPTDGFEPDALRFQWPGAITQSVEGAYGGSEFTAPDGTTPYRLAAFNLADGAYVGGQWQIIQPLVLKPHPLAEQADPALRTRLRRVADEVRKLCVTEADTKAGRQSKVHYRFYCYSDAAVAVRPSPTGIAGPPPPSAGWAVGTTPAVCSSLIWLGARAAGERLEGPNAITDPADLEASPDLVPAGAAVDGETLDGLYLYTADERAAAASWLFDYLVDKIFKAEQKEGGWFGGALNEAFSDMADDCANQICNTFAADNADGDSKNSDDWESPGIGRAVSPDNLMLWDDPRRSGRGLWGYAEPLVHHDARIERVPVTVWRKSGGPGIVQGHVRFMGNPVPGAYINAGGTTAIAGASGSFTLTLLEGFYALQAQSFISVEIGNAATTVEVQVVQDKTTTVNIDLQPPPDRYRLVAIDAEISFRDDEFTVNPFEDDPDEYASDHRYWELAVAPSGTHKETPYTKGWGGECRIEARIAADLNPDQSVRVTLSGDLFEGATENTHERDGQGSMTWTIPKGAVNEPHTIRITHESEDDTYAEFRLKITNRTQW